METEWVILNRILEMREKTKCNKFVGALTVELLRSELTKLGFNVSGRDVFIEGIPYELDLVIAREGRQPEEGITYSPYDVLAVLEIKFRGSYGMKTVRRTKRVFDSIRELNNSIECFYVSVSENKKYVYRITKQVIGYDCFELLTRETNLESALKRERIETTGDWQKLVLKLRALT